jgi:hypothetical protein
MYKHADTSFRIVPIPEEDGRWTARYDARLAGHHLLTAGGRHQRVPRV